MRAAVLHAPHDLRVDDRPETLSTDDGVVVEVSYNGLCGTDATEYSKSPMMVPLTVAHPGSGHVGPTTLGHEFIGTVVEAGPGARQWLGRRVASGAGVSCGACRTAARIVGSDRESVSVVGGLPCGVLAGRSCRWSGVPWIRGSRTT